jgi:predicted MPP superfamily phosphohydrolase
MRNELNWLHISDIHFCPGTEWRDSNIRSGLISYLQGEFSRNDSLRPDLIFCTGDIANGESCSSSLRDQYVQAKIFFDELLNVCGRGGGSLPKDRLFIVPGNHDVNRESINSDAQCTLTQWAKNSHAHSAGIEQRFNDRTKEFLEAVRRLDEYAQFVKEYVPHHLDNYGRHCYAKTVEIDGLKVGIAGFNSAWSCAGPEDDRAVWLAAEWQFNTAKNELSQSCVRIGLIHHPVDWLNVNDRDIATRRISTDFHFWLHGHSHNAWVAPTQNHINIAAGAVGALASEEFGINLVHIDLTIGKGSVYLHQHKAGGAGWTIAPVEIHAPSGCWSVELPRELCKTLAPLSPATFAKSPSGRRIKPHEIDETSGKVRFIRLTSTSVYEDGRAVV